jgi:hypothetical protein
MNESHFEELDKLAQKTSLNQTEQPEHVPQWKTARVFISSTFLDMHAER